MYHFVLQVRLMHLLTIWGEREREKGKKFKQPYVLQSTHANCCREFWFFEISYVCTKRGYDMAFATESSWKHCNAGKKVTTPTHEKLTENHIPTKMSSVETLKTLSLFCWKCKTHCWNLMPRKNYRKFRKAKLILHSISWPLKNCHKAQIELINMWFAFSVWFFFFLLFR